MPWPGSKIEISEQQARFDAATAANTQKIRDNIARTVAANAEAAKPPVSIGQRVADIANRAKRLNEAQETTDRQRRTEAQKAKVDENYVRQARLESLPARIERTRANIDAAEAEEQLQYDYQHPIEAEERKQLKAEQDAERARAQEHLNKVRKQAAFDTNSPELKARQVRQDRWDAYRADQWEAFYVAEAAARSNHVPRPDEPNLPKLVPETFETGHPTTRVLHEVPLAPLAAKPLEDRNAYGHKVMRPLYDITYVKPEDLPHPEDAFRNAAEAAKDKK